MRGVVTAAIKSNNSLMSKEYELMSIDIMREINRIPSAKLTLVDGNSAKQNFLISNTDFFKPGQEIEITLYYQGDEQDAPVLFKGIVIKHKIKATRAGSFLQLFLKDAAIKLTTQRKSLVYKAMQDNEIMQHILEKANLPQETIDETNCQHEQMLQYQSTDWDFLLSRAEANAMWIINNRAGISIKQPSLDGKPKYIFRYGIDDIYEFEMALDISQQIETVTATAWDIDEQSLLAEAKKAKAFKLQQGNFKLSSQQLAAMGVEQFNLNDPSVLKPEEVQAWANAQVVKSRLAMLRGRLKVPGFAKVELGDMIEIAGIGDRFNGKTLITSIRQQVNEQGWQTDIQFGLSADWFVEKMNVTHIPASGLLPAVHGLQIGIVQDYEEDETGNYRVKVQLPILTSDENTVWARLASIDAGNKRGVFFRPEHNDEVILGFFNNDPRQPVILGAMFSGQKNPIPESFEISEENITKGIVTKENLSILFNEQEKSIALLTPAGNKILLSDEGEKKGMFILDAQTNAIELNAEGIALNSSKNIAAEAKQNVKIKGQKIDTE